MKSVTATHARANFATLLRRAASGEQVCIERRGKIIAELAPKNRGFANDDVSGLSQRRAEALFEETERLAKLGHWQWDEVLDRCIYCSQGLARLYGIPVADYMEQQVSLAVEIQRVHPQDRTGYEKAAYALRATGQSYDIEFRMRHAQGNYIWVREKAEAFFDEGGKVARSVGFVQDITEQKETAENLRLSEEALRRAQKQAKIGSWRWDLRDKRLISCSDEYARLHGVTVEEAPAHLARQMEKVIHPDDRPRVAEAFKQIEEQGKDYEIEYRIVRPDGLVRHVVEIGETKNDERGWPAFQTGTVQDITERKEAAEKLARAHSELELRVEMRTAELQIANKKLLAEIASRRDAEKQTRERDAWLRGILEHSPVEIVIKDRQGRALAASGNNKDIICEKLGDSLVGSTAWDFLPPDIARIYSDADKHVLKTGKSLQQEVREEIDGKVSHYWNTKFPLLDETGYITGICSITNDITEMKTAEERLHQAQKMEAVGQLTGGVAHDFNNLLAVIQGNAELLSDQIGDSHPRLAAIHRASARGAELTQRLLAFSRRQPLQPRTIRICTLVNDMSELLRRTLGEPIELEVTFENNLWPAVADPGQVENALLNLAINARDAMPSGGLLSISCGNATLDSSQRDPNMEAKAGDYVVLSVSDNGCGMSADVKAHAFEPFFTTKEVGQGSGLGLSMVYGFAKQTGGQLSLESQPGQGTTVKLFLPSSQTEDASFDEPGISPAPRGQGERVLLVEDDGDVRLVTKEFLEDLGYNVIDVPDAEAAQRILASGHLVDLLLCDVVLSGSTNGPQFAEQARRLLPDLKVILMSGHAIDDMPGCGRWETSDFLLTKPFNRAYLAEALHRSLRS
ncbi:MAG: PAS domain-containing protein [Pseudomonadota bacterium]